MKKALKKDVKTIINCILAEIFDLDITIQEWEDRVKYCWNNTSENDIMSYSKYIYAVLENGMPLRLAKHSLLLDLWRKLSNSKTEEDLVEIVKDFNTLYSVRFDLYGDVSEDMKDHPYEFEMALLESIRDVWCNKYKIIISNALGYYV